MNIMPHIDATGLLVHTPVTHGHIITIVATPKRKTDPAEVIAAFRTHPRIRVVRIADGFDTNTSFFNYARFLGHPRGDMYEIGLFEETVGMSGNDIMFAVNIPQESVVIPETIDGIRASLRLQEDRLEAVGLTNKYLGMG
jgi:glyceraldehyde-3-phosphate dehydrogenase (NAD(P))